MRALSSTGGIQESTPEFSDEDEENDIELNIIRGALRLVSHKTDVDQKDSTPALNGHRNNPEILPSYTHEFNYGSTPSSDPISTPLGVSDDWAAGIDAVMASYQQLDFFSMPDAGLAAEADSFASLAPDMFTNPASDTHMHHSEPPGVAPDIWDAYGGYNVSDDSSIVW